ncbi:MAG: phage tail protein [Maritimibacter sp.]|nr:phage tail protein [Maritimibacter sp.]
MRRPVLNRRLELQAPVRVADGAGGYATTYEVLGEVWAGVRPGTGRDSEAAGLTLAQVPVRITVRGAPVGSPQRPVAGQRLREGSRVYRILAVTEADAAGAYIVCFAREEEVPA